MSTETTCPHCSMVEHTVCEVNIDVQSTSYIYKYITVGPVYKDHPGDYENVLSVDRWSLYRGTSV